MPLPRTLFARTVTIIAAVSLSFLLYTLGVIGYYMLVPVGKQAADDYAALMLFAAHSWAERPSSKRDKYAQELFEKYNLKIKETQPQLTEAHEFLPYYFFLETALEEQAGLKGSINISRDSHSDEWLWIELPFKQKTIFIGFLRSHLAVRPPLALFLLIFVGTLAILLTATVLVHYLTTPLERLTRNAQRIGSGEKPEFIPESGPDELVTLARSFNEMAIQVQELLSNRTTLLAGISHDLRTPLARTQLALEMLPEEVDPELVNGIRSDVEQMDCLIGQFLELSRDLERGEQQKVIIYLMLDDLVNCARRGGATIQWQARDTCYTFTNPLALRRIIANLLENAVRYGGGSPVEVSYQCGKRDITIQIMDRGPGIPAEQLEAVFRPFYRLEQSRNSETGGSGLGLSIAQQLAGINGQKLTLRPRDGGGTIAELKLPAAPVRE